MTRAFIWPLIAAAFAALPFVRGLSTTDVFYIRDLAVYFWPRHLWLRHTWASGDWPWWDPFAGAGQSAVADPLNQFFLLPVTAVRLLLPPALGFNFWVAAPFPFMAVGAWLWLRRHVSSAAACIGAATLCLAGPVTSTGDFPNMSWSVAFIPWILWACDCAVQSRSPRWFAAAAGLTGLQALAGEPVTFAGTCALALAFSWHRAPAGSVGDRVRATCSTGAALGVGLVLSAVQTVPMVAAARGSERSADFDNLFWSLNPLGSIEILVGRLFGHPYDPVQVLPWMKALNDGREPMLYSLYVGLAVMTLATIGRADRQDRGWRWFWASVGVVSLACAYGEHSFVYRFLESLLPVLQSFRFPVKYLVFAMVALAALVASGSDALLAHAARRAEMRRPTAALSIAFAGMLVAVVVIAVNAVAPDAALWSWESIASAVNVKAPVTAREAAEWIMPVSVMVAVRLAALTSAILIFVGAVWARHRSAPVAAWVICAAAILDPLSVNWDLHPTMSAGLLGPPEWTAATRAEPGGRVYVGGQINLAASRSAAVKLVDIPADFPVAAGRNVQEAISELSAQFAYSPAAWQVKQIVSYDLPKLWPREYHYMLDRFGRSSVETRLRFLRGSGIRYCFLPVPPVEHQKALSAPAISAPMALYECGDGSRAWIAPDAEIEPQIERQIDRLFDDGHDQRGRVLLQRASAGAAGTRGDAVVDSASIAFESNNEQRVVAGVGPGGGYLTVTDTFDPWWVVTVDGQPADLLRANGLFRAVHLPPGRHEVRFVYRPLPLYAGAGLSLLAAIAVAAVFLSAHVTLPVSRWLTVSTPLRTMRVMSGNRS